jgi:hypothetical protein
MLTATEFACHAEPPKLGEIVVFTITWTGRESSSQLGIGAALAPSNRFLIEWEWDSGHHVCNEHRIERSHQ